MLRQKYIWRIPTMSSGDTLYGGKLIYTTEDDLGPIQIVDTQDQRIMYFGSDATQTIMSLTDPFALTTQYSRYIMLSLLFIEPPKSALILGLGGGALVKFLWKYFPRCHVTAVDNRPKVVDVCYEFFHLPKSNRIHIHVDDALEFARKSRYPQYDLIIVDLFLGDGMPSIVGHREFFNACQMQLKEHGILGWNTWRTTKEELMIQSVHGLCSVFGKNLLILPALKGGNIVFLAFQEPVPNFKLHSIKSKALKLSKKTHLDFPEILSELKDFKDCGELAQSW